MRAVRSCGNAWVCRHVQDVRPRRRRLRTGRKMFNTVHGVEDVGETQTEEAVVYG